MPHPSSEDRDSNDKLLADGVAACFAAAGTRNLLIKKKPEKLACSQEI